MTDKLTGDIATFLRERYGDRLEENRWRAWDDARDCARLECPQASDAFLSDVAESVFERLYGVEREG